MPKYLRQDEKQAAKEELNAPKTFLTTRDDYDKHGHTRGCPGCRVLLTGTARQKHTAACRLRMEKELGDDDKVKAAKRRREEFLEKVMVSEGVKGDDSMVVEGRGGKIAPPAYRG